MVVAIGMLWGQIQRGGEPELDRLGRLAAAAQVGLQHEEPAPNGLGNLGIDPCHGLKLGCMLMFLCY